MANKILDPIFKLYDPIRYSFNKKKADYIIISPSVGSKSQLNNGASPTVITFNGKKISITKSKKLIDKYKYCKVRDDIDLERINANAKEGGFLPFLLSLIFGGLTAAFAIAGGTATVVSAVNDDKAAKVKAAEEHRHNLEMEK
ncbi:hypothetical protein LOTGIDRAFT_163240 [Lottia gigantea]|uniref:Uncharacterized protein n=1 Tax=Lottia gigantea TaxID=225164 RepID=V3ZKM4_LOTGI|nr:hypothetical protein LOTGIDRAFT_163240 [Lottia gigantea]ESO91878.1 hypothetical protein LOTGIDRAFT_163240 [Lottia gigantea]